MVIAHGEVLYEFAALGVMPLDYRSPPLVQTSLGLQPRAQVAQSVEQRTENPRVAGSIPALGTILNLLFSVV